MTTVMAAIGTKITQTLAEIMTVMIVHGLLTMHAAPVAEDGMNLELFGKATLLTQCMALENPLSFGLKMKCGLNFISGMKEMKPTASLSLTGKTILTQKKESGDSM